MCKLQQFRTFPSSSWGCVMSPPTRPLTDVACFPIFLDVQGETTNNLLAKKIWKNSKANTRWGPPVIILGLDSTMTASFPPNQPKLLQWISELSTSPGPVTMRMRSDQAPWDVPITVLYCIQSMSFTFGYAPQFSKGQRSTLSGQVKMFQRFSRYFHIFSTYV